MKPIVRKLFMSKRIVKGLRNSNTFYLKRKNMDANNKRDVRS